MYLCTHAPCMCTLCAHTVYIYTCKHASYMCACMVRVCVWENASVPVSMSKWYTQCVVSVWHSLHTWHFGEAAWNLLPVVARHVLLCDSIAEQDFTVCVQCPHPRAGDAYVQDLNSWNDKEPDRQLINFNTQSTITVISAQNTFSQKKKKLLKNSHN